MNMFDNIPVLAYHKVNRRFEWGVTRVLPSQFFEQMKFVYKKGYRVCTLSDILSNGSSDSKLCITFDDAYKDFMDNALSVLQKYHLKATVFVVTDFVGKKNSWDVNLGREFYHMSWQDLKYLSNAGFEIGSHTHRHPDLTRVSDVEVKNELFRSKQIIESKLGIKVSFLSYPFGRYSDRVKHIAMDCGYDGAVCLSHPFRRKDDIFELDRQGVYIFDTIYNFRAKLSKSGKAFYVLEQIKGRAVNFFAGITYPIKRMQYSFRKNNV